MSTRAQWLAVFAVVAVLGIGLSAAAHRTNATPPRADIGGRAPDFHATTVDTPPRPVTLADYRGQVVVLNVWATWCVPCRAEMPSLEALHREFAPRGLRIVAVSVDDPPDPEQKIREFRQAFGLTFQVLYDAKFAIERDYQTSGIPETFVIGADGVIRKRAIGATDWHSPANRALVAQLLREAGQR